MKNEKNVDLRRISVKDYENNFRVYNPTRAVLGMDMLHYTYDEENDCLVMQHNTTMDILTEQETKELIELLQNYLDNQEYYQAMQNQIRNEDKESQNINKSVAVSKNHSKKSFVYLMKDSNFIKIGISKDPMERLSQLRAGNPNLELLFTKKVSNAYKVEQELHEKYNKKRVGREWFDLSSNDIDKIKKYLTSLSKEGDK